MTKHYICDSAIDAIANNKPVTVMPIWAAQDIMADGTFALGIYLPPEGWLTVCDGLYLAGERYKAIAEAISERFGMVRVNGKQP